MTEPWECKPIGDICTIIGGGTPARSNDAFFGGPIPWATIRDMKSDWIDSTEFSITPAAVKNSATNILPAGTVIVASRVGLGKVCRTRNETAINQDLRGFIPRSLDQLDQQYLFLWFKSVAEQIVAAGTGATVQGVTLPLLRSLQIPLPPIKEQRRIVAALDEAFAAIATATANAEKNLINARGLFSDHREKILRSSAHNWAERPLSELCTIKHGFAFKSEYFCEAGRQVLLTPGNFFESGGYRDRGAKQKYYDGPIPNGFVLKGGDLLVAMTEQAAGLLGSPILIPESGVYLHNQRLGLVQPKAGIGWANEFFFHVFNTIALRNRLHRTGTGQKVRHTSPAKIGDVVVRFPVSQAEQLAVATHLNEVWIETEKLYGVKNAQIIKLEELKQSLLRSAFHGELASAKPKSDLSCANDNFATPKGSAQIIAFAFWLHKKANRDKSYKHVKAQKCLHNVESMAAIDLGRQPRKFPYGPHDPIHMARAEDWARQNGFFEFVPSTSGPGLDFRKLANYDVLWAEAVAAVKPFAASLERAIEPLVPMNMEEAELFATVHAAWNNLLRNGAAIDDDAIVREARENWDQAKTNIPRHRFHDTINLIRQKRLEPDGTGKYVGGQARLF